MDEAIEQPSWVCHPCGEKHGHTTRRVRFSTWHPDTCGVCGKQTSVTEARDFGCLRKGWEQAEIIRQGIG